MDTKQSIGKAKKTAFLSVFLYSERLLKIKGEILFEKITIRARREIFLTIESYRFAAKRSRDYVLLFFPESSLVAILEIVNLREWFNIDVAQRADSIEVWACLRITLCNILP